MQEKLAAQSLVATAVSHLAHISTSSSIVSLLLLFLFIIATFFCTVDPGFYPANWLYIGRSLLQLGHVEEAGEWLRRAANCRSELGDDVEASLQ